MLTQLIKIRLKGLFGIGRKKIKTSKLILYALLMLICLGSCMFLFGSYFYSLAPLLHGVGLDWGYFALLCLSSLVITFVFGVFLVYQELYHAKDNELLMALPLKQSTILLSRISSILLISYLYELIVFLPGIISYLLFYPLTLLGIFNALIIFLTMPLLAVAISALIAYVAANVVTFLGRFKNLVIVIVFTLAFGAYLFVVAQLESFITEFVKNGIGIVEAIQRAFPPLYYLGLAISEGNMLGLLISLTIFILPFMLMVYILSTNFIKLCTSKPKNKKAIYKGGGFKRKSTMQALIVRELKHYFNNVMVILNGAMGLLFGIILLVALAIYARDVAIITAIPPLRPYFMPACAIVVVFISSMNIMSSAMISLEGKTLYILKSLPLSPLTILYSKFWTHFLLCVPLGIILSLALGLIFALSPLELLALIIIPIIFTVFIDLLGLLTNLWKPKFDWVNETTCVKQSIPSVITVLVSMILSFGIVIIYFMFFVDIDINLFTAIVSLIFLILDILLIILLNSWGPKRFAEL